MVNFMGFHFILSKWAFLLCKLCYCVHIYNVLFMLEITIFLSIFIFFFKGTIFLSLVNQTRMLHKLKLFAHLATLHHVHEFTSIYFTTKRLSNSASIKNNNSC